VGFKKYAVEMGSGAVIHTPIFIKIGTNIQKLMGEKIHRHTDSIEIALACFRKVG
jgi:hypothetical protein